MTESPAAGQPLVIRGKLTDGDGKGIASQRVEAGLNNAEGRDGGALTGPDGTFELSFAAPAQPGQATVYVRYAGNTPIPAATPVRVAVNVGASAPPSTTAPSTKAPSTAASTPSARPTGNGDAPPPPGIASLWPLALVGLLGLATVIALAVIAVRRRRETARESAATLEGVTDGDLRADD